MEEVNNGTVEHQLILKERNSLQIEGVEEILQFNEDKVMVQTLRGDLEVRGQDLHLKNLDLETGKLSIEGFVKSIVYDAGPERRNIWKRLFK